MADLSAVLEQYRIQFNSIREDMERRYQKMPENIEIAKTRLGRLEPYIKESVNMAIVNAKIHLWDLSSIGVNETLFRSMMEIYMWISVCLLIASLSFLLGAGAFYWLLQMFFDVSIAVLLSLLVLPVFFYYTLRKKDIAEDERRTAVLVYTMCSSLLAGYVLNESYLSFYPPPSFLTPLIVGLTAGFSPNWLQSETRVLYLTVSVAPSFAMYMMFGLVTDSFCLPYLLWSLIYCGLTVFDFQVKLGQCWTDGTGVASNQIITLAYYMGVGFVLNLLFGSSTPPR